MLQATPCVYVSAQNWVALALGAANLEGHYTISIAADTVGAVRDGSTSAHNAGAFDDLHAAAAKPPSRTSSPVGLRPPAAAAGSASSSVGSTGGMQPDVSARPVAISLPGPAVGHVGTVSAPLAVAAAPLSAKVPVVWGLLSAYYRPKWKITDDLLGNGTTARVCRTTSADGSHGWQGQGGPLVFGPGP